MRESKFRPLCIGAIASAAFCAGLAAQASADQPYMQEALSELGRAHATLEAGSTDKGGHRVRAIALVQRAEAEVRAGIRYDRMHGS